MSQPTNRPARKPRAARPTRPVEPVEYEDEYEDQYDDYDEQEPDEVDNTTADADTPEVVDRFEKYRARAVKVTGNDKSGLVTDEPFILGEADGFTPPISVSKPSFVIRLAIADAMKNQDVVQALRLMFGNVTNRVLLTIDKYEEQFPDINGEDIMLGMVIDYLEHFYGKGAADESFIAALN